MRSLRALIEAAGYKMMMVSGAAVANTYLGMPDIGLVSVTELAAHVAAVRDAVGIPILADADTGFGNAINARRTVKLLERAGANAIMLEDQTYPKRCGHFEGKDVIPKQEMVSKLKAAVDARIDPDLMILARTDARAVEGFEAALDRARAYQEAGADFLFVEAPLTKEELLGDSARSAGHSSLQHGDRRQDAVAAARRAGEGGLRGRPVRECGAAGFAAGDAAGVAAFARHRIHRGHRIEADDVRGAPEGAGRGKVQRTGEEVLMSDSAVRTLFDRFRATDRERRRWAYI